MNRVDTNVIIRYLVADDEAQAIKAKRFIESSLIYVNCIVLSKVLTCRQGRAGFKVL